MVDDISVRVALFLAEAAEAHDRGAMEDLHNKFDEAETFLSDKTCHEHVAIAYNFLDGWEDASNHDWQYYKGIKKGDWPALGREISEVLRRGIPIKNEIVLKHFDFRK